MKNRNCKRSIFRLFATVLFLMPLIVQAQEEELDGQNLEQYLIMAAENNPELNSLFKEYLAALEEVVQEGALPDPQLDFGYFIQPIETRLGAQRATASIQQKFPWFGTLDARQDVAAEKARMKLNMFNLTKKQMYRDIRILYNELYYIQTAIKITEENLELLESFKGISEVYFESGKAGFTSVLQVEMEEEELSSKLEFLKESELPLLTEFERLINQDLQEPIAFPDSLWEEQLLLEKQEIYAQILKNNPHLIHLVHKINIEEYEVEVAEKKGMPSFSLGMSYTNITPRTGLQPQITLPDNGQDAIMFPRVGISVPIFRGKYKAMRNQEVLEKEAAILRKENAENELLTELEQLYRDYLDAERRIVLYKRLSSIANQSLNLLQSELTTGQTDFFEIIRMQRQLLNYYLKLEKARIEKNNNVYRIKYLMGISYE